MSEHSKQAQAVVRNPLTVIAVFAGLAELSAVVALPQLEQDIQAKFVWFVMLFPAFLVGIFFVVLWKKHHVLYAPSDFTDEDNFMRHWVQSSSIDIDGVIEEEAVNSLATDDLPESVIEIAPTPAEPVIRTISEDRILEVRLAEHLALRRLEQTLNIEFKRNVQFKGRSSVRFDGVGDSANGPILVEVKYVRSLNSLRMNLQRELHRFASISFKIGIDEVRNATFLIVFVIKNEFPKLEAEEVRKDLEIEIAKSNLPFTVGFRIYGMEELKERVS